MRKNTRKNVGIAVVILLSIGILASIVSNQSNKSGSMALSKPFYSVDELCSESDLIVTVTVTEDKELFQPDVDESLKLNAIIQKVIVKEVLMNNTCIEISVDDKINYVSYDGYINKNTGSVDKYFESIELNPGRYVLFLKKHQRYEDIFVNNSQHNLYRLISTDFSSNMNLDVFKNDIGLALPFLNGQDVVETIKKLKMQE